MTTEANETLVRRLFDHFNRRAFDQAAALVTEDFALVDHAAGVTLHGPEGLQQWFQGFVTALPDARAELTSLIVAADWAASEHVGTGTHTGPLVGPAGTLPPTGRAIELQIAEIYQLRDGKLSHLRAYYDSMTLLRQLGAVPAPGQPTQ